MDPMNSVGIAAFSNKKETINGLDVVFLHPFAIVIFFLDYTHACGCHVETGDLVLLNAVPDDACIRNDRLTLEEDTGTASE